MLTGFVNDKMDVMEKRSTTEEMKTLATCINKLVQDGYDEDFKIAKDGLCSVHGKKCYQPDEVHIVNFFRFEGASDPADNSILYAIETDDGTKGTLTDAFGPYADENVNKFMKKVEDIKKSTN
jgi:hypothetical protein